MMRRTPLFQELLFTMVNSSNPHNYGKELRYKYRFAVFKEVSVPSTCDVNNVVDNISIPTTPCGFSCLPISVLDAKRNETMITWG